MHEVLVNRLGGLSLPQKGVVRLTDRPDMTLDVYRGRKTTMQQQQQQQQLIGVFANAEMADLIINVMLGGHFHSIINVYNYFNIV